MDRNLPFNLNNAIPAFADATECRRWLSQQPRANPVRLQAVLCAQLHALAGTALAASHRLAILEVLRDPASFAQGESARRFSARPLPLNDAEQGAFDANRFVWRFLADGYLACLQGDASEANRDDLDGTLVARRALGAMTAELLDHYRALHEPNAAFWNRLHGAFALARQHAVADAKVQAAYVLPLLLHASSPYELTPRQQHLALRWLRRWSAKVEVLTRPPADADEPALAFDPDSGRPATMSAQAQATRWLALAGVAHSIRKRLSALRRGEAPAALKLGEGCTAAECELLLRHIYEHCCRGGVARTEPRHRSDTACEVVFGFEAIHYQICGHVFQPPNDAATLSSQRAQEIALFGHVATRSDPAVAQQLGYYTESWQRVDSSRSGLGLMRTPGAAGARVAAGALIAVRSPGESEFFLGAVRWVKIYSDAHLHAGVIMLPGSAAAVAVRLVGAGAENEKYRQGFLLPPVPSSGEPASVGIPLTWYRPGRIVEVHDQVPQRYRLTRLCLRGTDFERAEYEPL
jgi:hypothetical protein